MAKPLLPLVPLLLLGVGLPIGLAVAHGLTQARWILQDTPRAYLFMAVMAAAVALLVIGPLLWFARAHVTWRAAGGGLLWAALAGWYGGPLVLNLMNHAADAIATRSTSGSSASSGASRGSV